MRKPKWVKNPNPAEMTIKLNMETLQAASGALIRALAKGAKGGIAISNDQAMEIISAILKALKKGRG